MLAWNTIVWRSIVAMPRIHQNHSTIVGTMPNTSAECLGNGSIRLTSGQMSPVERGALSFREMR